MGVKGPKIGGFGHILNHFEIFLRASILPPGSCIGIGGPTTEGIIFEILLESKQRFC